MVLSVLSIMGIIVMIALFSDILIFLTKRQIMVPIFSTIAYFAAWEWQDFGGGTYLTPLANSGQINLDVRLGSLWMFTLGVKLANGTLIDAVSGTIFHRVVPVDSSINCVDFGYMDQSNYTVTLVSDGVSGIFFSSLSISFKII